VEHIEFCFLALSAHIKLALHYFGASFLFRVGTHSISGLPIESWLMVVLDLVKE
jgi:hypothetical protein